MTPGEYGLAFVLLVALAGGWLRRIIGGGWPVIPWGIPRLLFGLPFAALLAGLDGHKWLWAASYLLSDAGIRLGHGQYQNLGFRPKQAPERDEVVDPIVTALLGPDVAQGLYSSYWRCVLGLSVTGLGVTLGPGALYALFCDPVAGAALAACGLLKPLGYMVGWKLWNSGVQILTANVYGEFWTGALMWGACAWIA